MLYNCYSFLNKRSRQEIKINYSILDGLCAITVYLVCAVIVSVSEWESLCNAYGMHIRYDWYDCQYTHARTHTRTHMHAIRIRIENLTKVEPINSNYWPSRIFTFNVHKYIERKHLYIHTRTCAK